MVEIADLTDVEAAHLLSKLSKIIVLATAVVENHQDRDGTGLVAAHKIYSLARDCRDLLTFDAVSRETMRKLLATTQMPVVYGLEFNQRVIDLVRN